MRRTILFDIGWPIAMLLVGMIVVHAVTTSISRSVERAFSSVAIEKEID